VFAVGVVCLVDGKPGVMEYSELDEKHRNLKDENGKLVYGASHICMNLYSVAFLKKVAATRLKTLP
jgi:UDP-N-acetylglucosamine/UDP-N-acetylgalactosamine diphosphorylase